MQRNIVLRVTVLHILKYILLIEALKDVFLLALDLFKVGLALQWSMCNNEVKICQREESFFNTIGIYMREIASKQLD